MIAPFAYSDDERQRVELSLPRRPGGMVSAAIIEDLELFANEYLGNVNVSRSSPSLADLAKSDQETVKMLEKVKTMIGTEPSIERVRQRHSEELEGGASLEKLLCRLVANDQLSFWRLKREFARSHLEDVIADIKAKGSERYRAKDIKRLMKHREKYILLVINQWSVVAGMIPMADVSISMGKNSAMLNFMRAASDRVLASTGEAIEDATLVKLVSKLKHRTSTG